MTPKIRGAILTLADANRAARRHLKALGYLDPTPTNNTSSLLSKVFSATKRDRKRLDHVYAERGEKWTSSHWPVYECCKGNTPAQILHTHAQYVRVYAILLPFDVRISRLQFLLVQRAIHSVAKGIEFLA